VALLAVATVAIPAQDKPHGGRPQAFGAGGDSSPPPLVEVTTTRDSLQRVSSEAWAFLDGLHTRVVTSGYALPGGSGQDFGFRRSLTYPSGFVASLAPDRLLRVADLSLSLPAGPSEPLARYNHAGARAHQRRLAWGTGAVDWHETTFAYDGQRRLASLDVAPSVVRFDYERNAEGHLTGKRYERAGSGDPNGSDRFRLEEIYRQGGAKLGVPGTQFGLDFESISRSPRSACGPSSTSALAAVPATETPRQAREVMLGDHDCDG
jgi:hypothetical protein